ncbi:MAG: universal stress protein [Gaiellaceae bacterium]
MTLADTAQTDTAVSLFDRIVVGIDETPESLEAARQAAVLRSPGGTLHLLAVVDAAKAIHTGFAASAVADQMLNGGRQALDRAAETIGPTTSTLLTGRPTPLLLQQLRRHQATLVALGCHHHRRTAGLLVSAVGSVLLRDAPCSLLLARRESWPEGRPERIVAGVDGSPESARAVEVARALRDRFGARLALVVGVGGKLRDASAVTDLYPEAIVDERPPVDALVAASCAADLVVVGSHGLHGLQALGSVSERVAHRAHASVLVVRDLQSRPAR